MRIKAMADLTRSAQPYLRQDLSGKTFFESGFISTEEPAIELQSEAHW